jgi:spore cortex formation protein SpoVR/YcgB (stage V sporulation)
MTLICGTVARSQTARLVHLHDGGDLRLDWAKEVLGALVRIWRRPVLLETIVEGRARRVGHDGQQPSETDLTAVAEEARS